VTYGYKRLHTRKKSINYPIINRLSTSYILDYSLLYRLIFLTRMFSEPLTTQYERIYSTHVQISSEFAYTELLKTVGNILLNDLGHLLRYIRPWLKLWQSPIVHNLRSNFMVAGNRTYEICQSGTKISNCYHNTWLGKWWCSLGCLSKTSCDKSKYWIVIQF